MRRPASDRVSRQGVSFCQRLFGDQYGWLFREQSVSDYGIDAHAEVVADHLGDLVTGKLLGIQIKAGKTYFREVCGDGWILRPSDAHVRYWAGYAMPVVVVIYDPETDHGYWQAMNGYSPALARLREGGWKLWVPRDHDLEDAESKRTLMKIIGGGGVVTYSLPDTTPWNTWSRGTPVSAMTISLGQSDPGWQQPSFWELRQDAESPVETESTRVSLLPDAGSPPPIGHGPAAPAGRHPLTELEERLVAVAKEYGFLLGREPVRYYCELVRGDIVVYLDRQRTGRHIIGVFLHPETDLERLPRDAGFDVPGGFRHADGMGRFPKKLNKGKRPSSYGYPITCQDLTAFGRLLAALR